LILLDQVVSRNEKTASRILAGEAVVLTPLDSKIHGFNETGSRIWELLADQPTLGEIVVHIHREFEVSEEQARSDVVAFIEELVARGMVTLGQDPGED
jgi:predicted DNA-binding transcriptional regulator